MAGIAPRSSARHGRLVSWVESLSDLRLSLYMLIAALLTIALVYAVDWRYFG